MLKLSVSTTTLYKKKKKESKLHTFKVAGFHKRIVNIETTFGRDAGILKDMEFYFS